MANKTITQLDAAQSLNDNMVIAVQDTNTTYKTTLADVKAYCGGGSGGSTYSCVNKTGSAIAQGERVYIAANSNLTLITADKYNKSTSWTGVAAESIADNATGSVNAALTTPVSGLTKYARINDIATVAGFFTDGNGTKYAVCVIDSSSRYHGTGSFYTCEQLPQYSTAADALAATESATYLNEILKDEAGYTYAGTLTYNGQTYNYLRPNAAELQMLKDDAVNLDSYDPTAATASSDLTLAGALPNNVVYSCTGSPQQIWYLYGGNWYNANAGYSSYNTRIYVVEIPVED